MKRPAISNSNILVIGGAGFIGSHLIDRLIEGGAKQVIAMDNLFTGKKTNLNKALDNGGMLYVDDAELQGSLDYLFDCYNIDIVFNCATKPLNYSFLNPANAYSTNVLVLKNVLELQRKKRFKTLCHFSSSETYGTAIYEPMDEDHPLNPHTTYAAGKASADLLLQSYVRMYNLDSFIVRPFNNYGPRQNYEGGFAGIIPSTIIKILNGEPPEIHGTGYQNRDFIYVNDTVDIILKAYSQLKEGDVVNITTDQQLTINEVVKTISQVIGWNSNPIYKSPRSADVTRHRGSTKKLKEFIGEYNPTDFITGITSTIDWIKKVRV